MTIWTTLDVSTPVHLAYAPPPLGDEPFPSWMNRIAAVNDLPLIWVLHHVGLAERQHYRAAPRGYGLHLTEPQVQSVSRATGVAPDRIQSTLLSSWVQRGVAIGETPDGTSLLDNPRLFAYHNWLYTHGSHYCPQCLTDRQGAWRLEWKLPYVYACTVHKRFLLSRCPQCGLRSDQGRIDGTMTPAFPVHVPDPGTCHNPRKNPHGKRYITRCSHNLAKAAPGARCPAWLLDHQETVLQALRSPLGPAGAGPRDWWHDLRALTCLVLATLDEETAEATLGRSLPTVLRDTWDAHTRERVARLRWTRQEVRGGLDYRAAPKETVARTPPTDPHLLATATAMSLHALADDSVLAAVLEVNQPTSLRPIARLRNYRATIGFLNRARRVQLGDQHELAVLGFDRVPQRSRSCFTWDPNNLPPLMWDDLYESHIAGHLDGVPIARRTSRRFCSIALYRAATGCTWSQATERFRDRVVANPRVAYSVLYSIRRTRGQERVSEVLLAVDNLGRHLAKEPRMNTYREDVLRAAIDLSEPLSEQAYMASYSGAGAPTRSRRLWAAVHAWVIRCSDDPANAPVWGPGRPTQRALEAYRNWTRRLPGNRSTRR